MTTPTQDQMDGRADPTPLIKDLRSQKWTSDYKRGVATIVDILFRLERSQRQIEKQTEETESLKFKLKAADRGLELLQAEIDALQATLHGSDQVLNHAWNQGYYSHVGSSKEEWGHEEKVNEWKDRRDKAISSTEQVTGGMDTYN